MSKRSKHSKSIYSYDYKTNKKNQPKLKKSIFVVLFSVFVLSNIFNNTQIKVNNVSNNTISSTDSSNLVETTVASVTPVAIDSEDDQVKNLIQAKMEKCNLNNDNFAFFYYNEDEHKYYFYNNDSYFTAASTVKVPIAMYYYDMIKNNQITLDTNLKYTQDCYEEGGGKTAYTYKYNDNVPISFLLNQSIVNSDNTAVNILIKNLGDSQYRKDIATYSSDALPDEFYNNNITSTKYSYDVLNHLYKNQDLYSQLINDMKNSSMGQYLKKYINGYDVAHKYGSYEGYTHDYGIVFGKQTYLIGVFTKNVPDPDELIADISLDIFNYTLKK